MIGCFVMIVGDIHTAMTLTKVVLPLYCSPTRVNSISSFQNRDLNQSRIRLIRAIIFALLWNLLAQTTSMDYLLLPELLQNLHSLSRVGMSPRWLFFSHCFCASPDFDMPTTTSIRRGCNDTYLRKECVRLLNKIPLITHAHATHLQPAGENMRFIYPTVE